MNNATRMMFAEQPNPILIGIADVTALTVAVIIAITVIPARHEAPAKAPAAIARPHVAMLAVSAPKPAPPRLLSGWEQVVAVVEADGRSESAAQAVAGNFINTPAGAGTLADLHPFRIITVSPTGVLHEYPQQVIVNEKKLGGVDDTSPDGHRVVLIELAPGAGDLRRFAIRTE